MTLLDHFAGQALVGLACGYFENKHLGEAPQGSDARENMAVASYLVAEKMIEEKRKREHNGS